jgi:hypothetical protein
MRFANHAPLSQPCREILCIGLDSISARNHLLHYLNCDTLIENLLTPFFPHSPLQYKSKYLLLNTPPNSPRLRQSGVDSSYTARNHNCTQCPTYSGLLVVPNERLKRVATQALDDCPVTSYLISHATRFRTRTRDAACTPYNPNNAQIHCALICRALIYIANKRALPEH